MTVIAFITNHAVIDKIIHHLGITFTARRPPPPAPQEELYRSIAPRRPLKGITVFGYRSQPADTGVSIE
jgi:hypothetical protein